jgi:hypothetical protein
VESAARFSTHKNISIFNEPSMKKLVYQSVKVSLTHSEFPLVQVTNKLNSNIRFILLCIFLLFNTFP